MKKQKDQIRDRAEQDLESFIRLVHPQRVLGACHVDLINWWTRPDAKSHQLVLLPRDHGKSAMVAYRVAWEITRNPTIRVLYISSTSNLAIKQLKFIKDILTSPIYRKFWPEMVELEESKREKWTETEISVDHPLRKAEAVRDPTIFTAGLTTTITGLHCDIAVLDDVVIKENAYTEEGRAKVQGQYSLLSSIEGADSREWVVGTRYSPLDLYNDLQSMDVDMFNRDGERIGTYALYEVFERKVENIGDGTGEFLWPRQMRDDGKWFGFNQDILAKKRAQYLDRGQFRSQYYNETNDPGNVAIKSEFFQYYEPKHLHRTDGKWYYKSNRLNIFAAIDFAFSINRKADYSCVVVVGVDTNNNYYVLEIDRFKTTSISEYFKSILRLHQKWDFRRIRAEVSVAQAVIVKDLKENYIRPHGLALSIEEFRPTRYMGSKEERVQAILQARYENLQIWHYRGGNCQTLEEELTLERPAHDDIKDCLASVIDACVAPTAMRTNRNVIPFMNSNLQSRFGGVV